MYSACIRTLRSRYIHGYIHDTCVGYVLPDTPIHTRYIRDTSRYNRNTPRYTATHCWYMNNLYFTKIRREIHLRYVYLRHVLSTYHRCAYVAQATAEDEMAENDHDSWGPGHLTAGAQAVHDKPLLMPPSVSALRRLQLLPRRVGVLVSFPRAVWCGRRLEAP